MQVGDISWGADVPISMPDPIQRYAWVDMGGFAFTIRGLAHDFTESDYESFMFPTFGPDYFGLSGEVPI